MIYGDIDYLVKNFEKVDGGWIAYKTFNMIYVAPFDWKVEEDSWISEDLDDDPLFDCSFGINVGPSPTWVKDLADSEQLYYDELGNLSADIWKVLIPDDASIVVPDGTFGKIRANRVKLLSVVDTVLYFDHPMHPGYVNYEGADED